MKSTAKWRPKLTLPMRGAAAVLMLLTIITPWILIFGIAVAVAELFSAVASGGILDRTEILPAAQLLE